MTEFSPLKGFSDARAVQRLNLQQARMLGYQNPEDHYDPHNIRLVWRQMKLLKQNPQNYEGAFFDNWMAGYVRTAEWTIDDEIPFSSDIARGRLRELQESGMSIDPLHKLGVSALIVSNRLDEDMQYDVAEHLLDRAIDRGIALGNRAVNIVVTEPDPILEAVRDHGFLATGRIADYPGSTRTHRLYTKPLDS